MNVFTVRDLRERTGDLIRGAEECKLLGITVALAVPSLINKLVIS